MKRSDRIERMAFIFTAVVVALALAVSISLAQGDFLKLEYQGGIDSSTLTPPSDGSWVLLYLPLGKYCFDTSFQLDQMSQNKVSPKENDNSLEQKALTLQFSLKW